MHTIYKKWEDGSYIIIEHDGTSYIKIQSDPNNNIDRNIPITIKGEFGEKIINITQLGKYEEFTTSENYTFYDKNDNKFIVKKTKI